MNSFDTGSESERPLLTFALFAYNQEQFIAEAVQGALSQTYSPLEIILSDDCSPDRTFAIMQEMAAAYEGPHIIILNRNEKNLGLVGHINRVMEMVNGELIVVAAGDDVSLPHRTARLVQAYLESGKKAYSLHSSVQKIDVDGHDLEVIHAYSPKRFTPHHLAERTISVIGNSHAWHRSCFDMFGPIDKRVIQEDVIIPFRAALLGEVHSVPDILVLRRYHTENMWLHPANSSFQEEMAWHRQRLLPRIDNLAGIWETKIADLSILLAGSQSQHTNLDWLLPILERRLLHIKLEREFYLADYCKRVKILPSIWRSNVPFSRFVRWVTQYGFTGLYYRTRRLQRRISAINKGI